MRIVFLAQNRLSGIIETGFRDLSKRKKAWSAGVRSVTALCGKTRNMALYKFSCNLPFLGTLLNFDEGPSVIRLRLVLPGKDLRRTVQLEAHAGGAIFDEYRRAFELIIVNSKMFQQSPDSGASRC